MFFMSRNVNMQRIGFMFTLREIFDVAHYHGSVDDFVQI